MPTAHMDVPSHGSRRGALGSLAHLVFPGELEAMKLFKHIWLGGGSNLKLLAPL